MPDVDGPASWSDPKVRTRVGANILALSTAGTAPHYIERRTETTGFLDAKTAIRQVEVHLRLAGFEDRARFPLIDGCLLLPIAKLRHRADGGRTDHKTFQVRDEAGHRLPRLTMEEERELVFRGLWLTARRVLRHDPSDVATGVLFSVVHEGGGDALRRSTEPDVERLRNSPRFVGVALDAANLFHLIAMIPPNDLRRRVVTYEYHEEPAFDDGLAGRAARRVFRSEPGVVVTFETPNADFANSFHFELTAPPDLLIPEGCGQLEVERVFAEAPDPPILDDDRSDLTAHVHYRPVEPITKAEFRARLIPAETGVVWGLRACVVLATALNLLGAAMVWGAPFRTLNQIDRSALATLMLLAPAVVTTALAIRSRHGLTSRMTYGLRATAVVPVIGLFAGTLASSTKPLHLGLARVVWTLSFLACVPMVIRVVSEVSWLRSARKEPI